MIVLDTNVVSELMEASSSPTALQWMGRQIRTNCYTTSVTQAEILHGVLLLAAGQRRRAIEGAADAMFKEDFAGRSLPFDTHAARHYAELVRERRRRGRPISQFDAQIGAIVRASGATLATGNVKDFEQCGVDVVDPWTKA